MMHINILYFVYDRNSAFTQSFWLPLTALLLNFWQKLQSHLHCSVLRMLCRCSRYDLRIFIRRLAVQPLKTSMHVSVHSRLSTQTIDAMDPWEDLTELGYHLADLPVEPHLGKMVLCSVVLKCLDPILTIACSLAHREPFVLPAQASQKRAAMLCRRCFTANTFSDHMALLRSFQVH